MLSLGISTATYSTSWGYQASNEDGRNGQRYLSILRTKQKRMEATLGPRIFPRDRNLWQLYAHCALNMCFYPFHCAIIALPLSLVGLFALIFRPHCAASVTVALMIMSKVLFRCFQLLHIAFMLWFHFRLTFSTPLHCSRQSTDPLRWFKPTLWPCHTYPRSPWRSHCDLKSTEAWGKAQYGLWERSSNESKAEEGPHKLL